MIHLWNKNKYYGLCHCCCCCCCCCCLFVCLSVDGPVLKYNLDRPTNHPSLRECDDLISYILFDTIVGIHICYFITSLYSPYPYGSWSCSCNILDSLLWLELQIHHYHAYYIKHRQLIIPPHTDSKIMTKMVGVSDKKIQQSQNYQNSIHHPVVCVCIYVFSLSLFLLKNLFILFFYELYRRVQPKSSNKTDCIHVWKKQACIYCVVNKSPN